MIKKFGGDEENRTPDPLLARQVRLPCYDFTPIIAPTFDGWLQKVTSPASGVNDFRGVTGGVYKARERIHRSMLTCDY